MNCSKCNGKTHVIDSRARPHEVWRRRACTQCGARFNTSELTEDNLPAHSAGKAIRLRGVKQAILRASTLLDTVMEGL